MVISEKLGKKRNIIVIIGERKKGVTTNGKLKTRTVEFDFLEDLLAEMPSRIYFSGDL